MCVLAASKWRQLFHQAHKWLYYEVLIDCMLCGHGYKQMFKHCTNNVGCYSVCEGCQHRDVRVCLCVAMAVSLWIDAGQLKFGSLWCWWAVESSHLTAHQCDRAFSHSLSFLVSLSPALPLSICLLLTSSPSFSSLCPPSLSLPLLPNWLRKPEWLSDPECTQACVCVCVCLPCLQAVARAWLITWELLFRPAPPPQSNSWLRSSIIIVPIHHSFSALSPAC